MRIYFACPLISAGIWNWIRPTVEKIELLAQNRNVEVEIAFPYDANMLEDFEVLGHRAKLEIFCRCKSLLDGADIVVALLDSIPFYESGAWEVGYFYRLKLGRPKRLSSYDRFLIPGIAAQWPYPSQMAMVIAFRI